MLALPANDDARLSEERSGLEPQLLSVGLLRVADWTERPASPLQTLPYRRRKHLTVAILWIHRDKLRLLSALRAKLRCMPRQYLRPSRRSVGLPSWKLHPR